MLVAALALAFVVDVGARAEAGQPERFSVSRQKLEEHVAFLAQAPRTPGSAHLAASRDHCAERLRALGYRVERQDVIADGFVGQNVIGTRPGATLPDEAVIVSAHIDSVPACLGADDNASGVAAALETARLLAQAPHARTAVVACWDLEEVGLLGARAYAQRAAASGQDIRVSFVYESVGFATDAPGSQRVPGGEALFGRFFPRQLARLEAAQWRGDFIAIAADAKGAFTPKGGAPFAADVQQAAAAIGIEALFVEIDPLLAGVFSDVLRSDHAAFWEQNYSAVLITDTANLRNPHYHCRGGQDSPATLDFDFARKITQATASAARRALDTQAVRIE